MPYQLLVEFCHSIYILALLYIIIQANNILIFLILADTLVLSIITVFAGYGVLAGIKIAGVYALFILILAAAEVACGLAILINQFKLTGVINFSDATTLVDVIGYSKARS